VAIKSFITFKLFQFSFSFSASEKFFQNISSAIASSSVSKTLTVIVWLLVNISSNLFPKNNQVIQPIVDDVSLSFAKLAITQ